MKNAKVKEIGGYIELDQYILPILHESAIALNCGRNCLKYLIKEKRIRKIALPYFICNSVKEVCVKENANICYYHINKNFHPENLELGEEDWIYLVNYYGQLSAEEINEYRYKYKNIIVDNAQAYFEQPLHGVNTLYTCRKFFGVPDGAFLYTDSLKLMEELDQDESYDRMGFILGRYERPAAEFYDMYVRNNDFFSQEPIKKMSKLTMNLLRGIDYDTVKQKRTKNYNYMYEKFEKVNRLKLKKIEGAFAYPLLVANGFEIKRKIVEKKIYIPTLWPEILDLCESDQLEYDMAKNILPLPVDQRYSTDDMEYMALEICRYIER